MSRRSRAALAGLILIIASALACWALVSAGAVRPSIVPGEAAEPATSSTSGPEARDASTSTTDSAGQVSLLYSLSAGAGTLTPLAGSSDEYTLELSHTDAHVLWFAVQPSRKAGVLPTSGFASEWAGFGFAEDPPNVAVILQDAAEEEDTVVAEMQTPAFDADTGVFSATLRVLEQVEQDGLSGTLAQHSAKADPALPASFTAVSLFIDDVTGAVVNGCLLQPFTVCVGADLAGAKLAGMNLTGADFTGADLSGADLSGAKLLNANFTGANLTGANLLGADITGAIFLGATMTDAQLPVIPPAAEVTASPFCSSASVGAVVLADGLIATSFSAPRQQTRGFVRQSMGDVTLVGPDGLTLDATFTCTNPAAAPYTEARARGWTLTINAVRGGSSALEALTLQPGRITGTIVRHNAGATWAVTVPAKLSAEPLDTTGALTITGPRDWTFAASGVAGVLPDTDSGTLTASAASGSITYASGTISGNVRVAFGGTHKFVRSLPTNWTKSTAINLGFSRVAGDASSVNRSVTLSVAASSGSDSLTVSGPWTPTGYTLAGGGVLHMNGTAVAMTGLYQSGGTNAQTGMSQTDPEWKLTGSLSGVSLDGGATIATGKVTVSSEESGIFGTARVQPQANNAFTLQAELDYFGPANWTLAIDGEGSAKAWAPAGLSGMNIKTEKVSGSIASTPQGGLVWALSVRGASGTLAKGVSLAGTLTLTNTCPLTPTTDCGTTTGIFFGFIDGKLGLPAPMHPVPAQGAIRIDGSWAFIQADAGSTTFVGPGGADVSLTNADLTISKGSQNPGTIPGLGMPDLSAENSGFEVEFCGDLDMRIPAIDSGKSSGGCVDWTPNGIAVGMVGLDGSTPGGNATAGSAGSGGTGVAVGPTTFTGLGWTNLTSAPQMTLNGAQVTLTKGRSTLAGTMALPGALLDAVGKSGVNAAAPAIGTLSDANFSLAKASFTVDARLAVGSTGQGFALNAVTVHLARTATSADISLGVDASYSVDGHTYPVVLKLAAGSGSGLTVSLTATGTPTTAHSCDPTCDGVSVPLATPQTGYAYLTNAFGGVPGVHLWSVTGQVEVTGGTPGFGVGATVYLNPQDVPNLFHGTTWMKGDFYVNVSDVTPCFMFDFGSSDPQTYLQVKGGVLKTSNFQLAIAPQGCEIGTLGLPAGSSFIFDATLGTEAEVHIDLAIGRDANGAPTFTSSTEVQNVKVGAMTVIDMRLTISLTAAAQSVTFVGNFTLTVGSMHSSFDLTAAAGGGVHFDGAVSLVDWTLSESGGSSGFDMESFSFQMTFDTSTTACGSFSADTSGSLSMGKKTHIEFDGTFSETCGVLHTLTIDFDYSHNNQTYGFDIAYSQDTGMLSGALDWSFSHNSTHRFTPGGYKYERGASIAIFLEFSLDTNHPSVATFGFRGTVTGNNVSGSVECSLSTTGDDSCSASIHVEIPGHGHFGASATW